MRELLIRYLLGELDEHEHEDVHRRLLESPELRRELSHLRSCIANSHEDEDLESGPPKDLATRTAVRVSESDEYPAWKPPVREAVDPPAGAIGWNLADLAVAGGCILAFSMLLFPALGDSRNATRRNMCQRNLQQLGQVTLVYADDHGNLLPRIAPDENAGSYVVELSEKGYIAPQEIAVLLICPAAPLADAIRDGKVKSLIPPTREQLARMSPRELAIARRFMSPFYDYPLPYRQGEKYVDIKVTGSSYEPMFSDRAASRGEEFLTPNHCDGIIQVVYQDGRVRALKSRMSSYPHDDMSFNWMGVVAAGWGPRDVVLGRSESTPAADIVRVRK